MEAIDHDLLVTLHRTAHRLRTRLAELHRQLSETAEERDRLRHELTLRKRRVTQCD